MKPSVPEDLNQIITRLCAHEQVAGVLAIGSLAHNALAPTSDYDLVIVLREMDPTWYVGVTHVGGRFADLLFVSANALREIRQLESPLPTNHELVPVVRWLRCGSVLFDRDQVRETQQFVQQRNWIQPISDSAAYSAWFATNYNLSVACRLARAVDPLRAWVADIRIAVYGHADLWFNYFGIRQIPWQGDKAAAQYLQDHDARYLKLYKRFLAARDRTDKLELYRRAAAHVTEPLGGLWTDPVDVTDRLSPPWTWSDLLGTPDPGNGYGSGKRTRG
jgi:hypothetical protein